MSCELSARTVVRALRAAADVIEVDAVADDSELRESGKPSTAAEHVASVAAPAPKSSRRRPPPAPCPLNPPSEVDQARARRDLRRLGAVAGRTR